MSAPELKWKLLTKKRGSATQGIPAGKEHLAWVTNTVTLIHGERDAVLVDTFLSARHSRELLDWVVESDKNLVTIYVTHAHGDHFFGLKLLLDRFPNAKAVATAPVVAAIENQIKPDFLKSFWEPRFPGQLPSQLIAPELLDGDTFYLEGQALKVVDLGHTDTSHSTGLHVPSVGLVISGDCVYNDTHLYLAECDSKARNEWLQALDRIESLDPKAVVAGHGVLDPDSSPRHIDETRRYLHDFQRLRGNYVDTAGTLREDAFIASEPGKSRVALGGCKSCETTVGQRSPSDLPIKQPTKIEILVNLRTAREVGIAIPQSILVSADEVIR